MVIKRNVFIICTLLLGSIINAQTYNWTGFPTTTNSATKTFVNGNMTAVVSAVTGGGQTGYSNGNSSQIGGSGVCGGTPSGLFLEMSGASTAWNNSINVAITFAVPVCAPATFTIYDVNEDIWNDPSTSINYSNYDDQVTIGAADPTATAIAPINITYGGCAVAGNVNTVGNNKILRGRWTSNGCKCSSATVTINGGGQMIKTINILYNNCQPPSYAKYGICQFQNIVISPIVVSAPPTASITAPTLGCGSTTNTLTASTSAVSPTYSWAGPAGSSIVSPASASTSVTGIGTYTVTINPGGCSATETYTIAAGGSSPNLTPGATQTITCTLPTPVISASSTTAGVTYAWTGPGTITPSNSTSGTVSNSGTYTVTITDPSNGCTNSATVNVITNTTLPNITPGADLGLNCTTTSGTISASSTTPGATYSWAGPGILAGGTTLSPTVNAIGTYTVTVSNPGNGCTNTSTVNVTNTGALPNVSPGAALILNCITTSGTITASSTTAGVTYSWVGTGIVSGGATSVPTVNSVGTYTVTVTDPNNGCTNTATVSVTNNGVLPNVTQGSPLTLNCTVSSGTISASSTTTGVTYNWTGTGIVSGGTTSTATVNSSGTYTVTVTDPNNGCINSSTVTVTNSGALPNVTPGTPLILNCTTTSGTISASSTTPGATYSWAGPGILAGGTTLSPTVNAIGTYTVTVSNPGNGCTNTSTVNVTNTGALPNVSPGAALILNCITTSGTITASSTTAGVTYSWVGTGIVSGGATSVPTVNSVGTYTVTVTDPNNGCTNTATVSVTNNGVLPNVTQGSPLTLNCTVSSGTISASSTTTGVTYNWTGTGIVSGGTTSTATVISSGTYTVTVTDPNNGCTNTSTVTVTSSAVLPNVTPGAPLTLNCITTSGTISASSSTVGVTYNWSGPGITSGGSTSSPRVNSAGTYTVTVADTGNGCVNSATLNVISSTVIPNVTPGSTLAITCSATSGLISASSTTAGVTYSWAGPGIVSGNNTSSPTVNAAGTYTVTVTSSGNGCTNITQVAVSVTPGPSAIAGPNIIIIQGNSATLTAGGGGNYLWSNGDTAASITVSPSVTSYYCVTVSDASNCTDTACAKVLVELPCSTDKDLKVPNAFSPNDDGVNDQFCLQGWNSCISQFRVCIFDRWGEKVFESADAAFCWDGTYKGKVLDPAVFVYYITATLGNKESLERKGNISLVR